MFCRRSIGLVEERVFIIRRIDVLLVVMGICFFLVFFFEVYGSLNLNIFYYNFRLRKVSFNGIFFLMKMIIICEIEFFVV